MAELSFKRVKNMYKINAKKESEKYFDIPKPIIEAELYTFNIKLGELNSSDEIKTLYYQFKSKLDSLSEINTPAITTQESDDELKKKQSTYRYLIFNHICVLNYLKLND